MERSSGIRETTLRGGFFGLNISSEERLWRILLCYILSLVSQHLIGQIQLVIHNGVLGRATSFHKQLIQRCFLEKGEATKSVELCRVRFPALAPF